jgi:iron complex outermembrane receptor protein
MATTALMFAVSPLSAQVQSFNVPAQSVQTAIGVLGRQADVQILAAQRVTAGKEATAVHGNMPVLDALAHMLAGTGLIVRQTGPHTYTIMSGSSTPTAATSSTWARPVALQEQARPQSALGLDARHAQIRRRHPIG